LSQEELKELQRGLILKMAIAKCVFCGKEQEDFKGVYYVKNDGSVLYFSSGKCMKNHFKLKRDKRRVRWTEAFHLTREKRRAKARQLEQEKKTKEESRVKEKSEKEPREKSKEKMRDIKKVEEKVVGKKEYTKNTSKN